MDCDSIAALTGAVLENKQEVNDILINVADFKEDKSAPFIYEGCNLFHIIVGNQ